MSQGNQKLNTIFREFADYKRRAGECAEYDTERAFFANVSSEQDVLELTKTVCTVDADWIDAIEEGLTHIEKAINEARQFILSRGEVVPIEKVKRVSKDSVVHLARHSDLITREPIENDVVPDKLFMVERLSDFAVYENRFLYMLLCYLESFISLRYNKILDLTNTYNGSITLQHKVMIDKRKLMLGLILRDNKPDDWYLKQSNPLKATLERIDLILKAVIHFLATPLMQEVAKVPMLKPPITKTNVLKMNHNFKGAVALYDFVTAYDKAGYSTKNRTIRTSPLTQRMADEFAEVAVLTAFLTYKHSLGLEQYLKNEFEKEETLRQEAERLRLIEQIARLKRKISESGGDVNQYILLLEKHIKSLEQDSDKLVIAQREIEVLRSDNQDLTIKNQALGEEVLAKSAEIIGLGKAHEEQLRDINAKHVKQVADLNKTYTDQITELKSKHISELDQVKTENEIRVTALEKSLTEQTEQHKKEYALAEARHKEEISKQMQDAAAREKQLSRQLDGRRAECEELAKSNQLLSSRLMAMRKEHNLIREDEDFTTEASFSELERQYKVLKAFFKEEWKKTKKRIKQDIQEGLVTEEVIKGEKSDA